jgi:hypothetical protein
LWSDSTTVIGDRQSTDSISNHPPAIRDRA